MFPKLSWNDSNIVIEGLRATTARDARSISRLFFSQIRWGKYYLKYEIAKNSFWKIWARREFPRAHFVQNKVVSITLLDKLKLKTLNFEATRVNTLFKFNSSLFLKLTTKYFGIFFPRKMKASDAVSYILSMTTDQIVYNYTLWSTNCPRAE